MSNDIVVKGLPELVKFLDELPTKLQNGAVRAMLRAGATVIKQRAREELATNHSIDTSELADGLSVSTSVKGDTVRATLRTKGKHGYVANWVEHGTAAHLIAAKVAKDLFANGHFARTVHHPGAHPKPFMRPALDKGAQDATAAAAAKLKERLTKQGLDVGDIET